MTHKYLVESDCLISPQSCLIFTEGFVSNVFFSVNDVDWTSERQHWDLNALNTINANEERNEGKEVCKIIKFRQIIEHERKRK